MKTTTLKPICLYIFFLLAIAFSFAQEAEKCGIDRILELERQKNPIKFDQNRAQVEAFTLNYRQNRAARSTSNTVTIIPTVVHIMHNGEALNTYPNISEVQILSAISNLNDAFKNEGIYNGTAFYNNPMDIEFVLAKVKEDGTSTTGIERHNVTGKSYASLYNSDGISGGVSGVAPEILFKDYIWNPQDYMNIWIVNKIDGVDIGTSGNGTLGYATLPGSNPGVTDGLVCQARAFGYEPNYDPNNPSATPGFDFGTGLTNASGNGTADHEVGHYLNLLHTFTGDNNETTCPPLSGTVGMDDDGCPDIPPHIRTNSICPVDSATANTCVTPNGPNEYIHNFMDYSSDPCFTGFSNDQRTRVNATIDGPRSAFKTSLGHVAPTGNYPAAVTNTPNVQNDFNDGMGVYEITLNGNTYTSVSGYHDGRYINRVASQPATTLASNTAYNMTVKVGVGNTTDNELVDVYIDYNNDGTFTTSERVYQTAGGDGKKNGDAFSFNFTTPTTGNFVDNQKLRMRVISGYDNNTDTLNSAYVSDYGNIEDYSVIFNPKITYTFDNNAWLPDTPIGVATVNDDIVINTGTANISANTSCAILTINPGAALTVDSGVTVTTTTVNLNSTSQLFSSLISDGTVTGTVNYNRYVSQVAPTGTNDLISAPVDGQMFGAFATANSNLAASGSLRAFAPYNTSAGAFQNYDTSTNASTLINAGTGYRVGTTNGSTLTFTGNVRTNNILDVPLSNAAAGSAWNLIGNPYPSYVDFDTFFNTNKTEFDSASAYQAIYGYDGSASNGWTVWNLATIADGTITELIAPGQAFFVKSKSTGGLVDFNTSMRRTGSSDDFIVGRNSTTANVALSKLNLNSASNHTSTHIYFIENTTRGLDVGYDAGSYMGSASEFSIFSNLVEGNIGLDLAIQSLPYNDFNDVIVPLGIKALANEALTISIDDVSTLPSGINVYLEDTLENTFTLLNGNNYVFTSTTELNGTGRFYIRYSSESLSIRDNDELNYLQIYASTNPKELIVVGQLIGKTEANVYDIQGRLVMNKNLDYQSSTNHIDVSLLSTGIYIVKIMSDNQVKTQKVVIK